MPRAVIGACTSDTAREKGDVGTLTEEAYCPGGATSQPIMTGMSRRGYEFRLIEAQDPAELIAQLVEAGSERWSAVGYGVLPDGRRSVLMERKVKVETRGPERDGARRDEEDERDNVRGRSSAG